MLDFTIKHLKCLHCKSDLSLESIAHEDEAVEGFLNCVGCNARYPIVSKIPFLLEDLSSYFSIRMSLGGQLMLSVKSAKMKSFIKETLKKIMRTSEDTALLEKRWVEIYKQSTKSLFYSKIRSSIQKLPACDFVLEHGCSIGHVSNDASKLHKLVLGIDKSYYGILEAKKHQRKNLDFIVADSLNPPFGNKKFGLVIGLNLLDIIEPNKLLRMVSRQTAKFIMLSDPYDFERGKNSVKQRTTPEELRRDVQNYGFKLINGTIRPAYIPWKLNVNPRLTLNYKVDLIVGKIKD